MNKTTAFILAGAIAGATLLPTARPAQADTGSTLAIAAAALIVGSILVDSNNQPFYVSNGRHVYVSQDTATYYRSHGNGNNGYHGQQHNNNSNDGGQMHGRPENNNGPMHGGEHQGR